MQYELLQFLVDTLVGGLHVDDGAQLGLTQYLVVFGLAATDADNAFRHGQQRIHGRGVGVKLVEQGVAALHHLLVLVEGYALGHYQLHAVGIAVAQVEGGL